MFALIFYPMKVNSILTLLSLGLLVLGFAGCDSSSDNETANTGPRNSASFVGTSVSFNPTVDFAAGDNITYTNTEQNSNFPAAPTPTPGTYTYNPNADFTQGTLTLSVDGDDIVLEISDFVHDANDNITAFTARSGGQSYPVTVTGTLPAHKPGDGGGNGGSRADDIPAGARGTFDLVFFPGTSSSADLPEEGSSTTFSIGARTLGFNGRTLTDPVFFDDNETEWLFEDGSLTYGVSVSPTGGLMEINVYGPIETSGPSGSFGQFRRVVAVDLTSGRPEDGSVTATVESTNVPSSFPADATLSVGDTLTFVFAPDVVIANETTYSYRRTEAAPGSDVRFLVYDAPVNTFVDVVRIGVSTVGSVDFVTGIEIERTRNADAPDTGTVDATFTLVPGGN